MGTLREDGSMSRESNICINFFLFQLCLMGAIFFCTNFLEKIRDKMK
jgi:hypothetical protein